VENSVKKKLFGPTYWIRMAECCYDWHQDEPDMRWEKLMYFYLFKHYGYKE